jgi:hypothetical protein
MSLSQHILEIWEKSMHIPPKIPLIFYENEYMVTIDDSGVFLRFASSDGQIFLSLNQNCQIATPDITIGNNIYLCTKIDPVLCSPSVGIKSVRDLFVLNKVIAILL